MNIIKPLQLGVLHKTFTLKNEHFFCISMPIPFSLINGEILLEQHLWTVIGEQLHEEIFDMAMPKETGEVLVYGKCFAPNNVPAKTVPVHLQVSKKDDEGCLINLVDKELWVFGDRNWQSLFGAKQVQNEADFFTEMPTSYEFAYGGEGYKYNPSGKGFKAQQTENGEKYERPNIEYKNEHVYSLSQSSRPASFGRVDITWQPRADKSGTYDEKYLKDKILGLPDDIDWLYFNDAASDQWLPGYFTGDECYSISNMHKHHNVLSGSLPKIYGRAFVNKSTVNHDTNEEELDFCEVPTKLDTLWLFPNSEMGVMMYRGTIKIDTNDGADIRALLLACENTHDAPRTLNHYHNQLIKRQDPEHGYKLALFSAPLIAEGMVCGFEQVMDRAMFPLELLGKANADAFAYNKIADAKSESKLNILAQCNAAGLDPAPYMEQIDNPDKNEEQIKIEALLEKMAPGIITDPQKMDVFNIDLRVMDEIKAHSDTLKDQKIDEAKAQIRQEIEDLKARKDTSLFAESIALMEQKLNEIDLPPMWPRNDMSGQIATLNTQISDLEKEIQHLRKQGVPDEQLPKIDIDFDQIKGQLLHSEARLKEAYAMGAHLLTECRSPHPGEEAAIQRRFKEKFLSGESLINGDFACIDLSGMDLSGANLSGCYLEGVNFSDCLMQNVDLSAAILAGSNLKNARLINCNCEGANIGNTELENTQFINCNFNKAQLGNARFKNTNLRDCCIDEMNFLDTYFAHVKFHNISMKQCNFINPVFNDCCFDHVDLTQANFIKGLFTNVNFSYSTLDGANFIETSLIEADFSYANLINTRFIAGNNLTKSNFTHAVMDKVSLRNSKSIECDFSHASLNEADLGGAELAGSEFYGASIIKSLFTKSNLENANFNNVNLMESSFYKAYLSGANFNNSNLYCVNFLDATLGNNSYKDANLDKTILKDWRP